MVTTPHILSIPLTLPDQIISVFIIQMIQVILNINLSPLLPSPQIVRNQKQEDSSPHFSNPSGQWQWPITARQIKQMSSLFRIKSSVFTPYYSPWFAVDNLQWWTIVRIPQLVKNNPGLLLIPRYFIHSELEKTCFTFRQCSRQEMKIENTYNNMNDGIKNSGCFKNNIFQHQSFMIKHCNWSLFLKRLNSNCATF